MEREHNKRKIPAWLACLGAAVLAACLWAAVKLGGKTETVGGEKAAPEESLATAEAAAEEEAFLLEFLAAGRSPKEEPAAGESAEAAPALEEGTEEETVEEGEKSRQQAPAGEASLDSPEGRQQPVPLRDIYSEEKGEALFRCYEPDADSYAWEVYDLTEKQWKEAEAASIGTLTDELGRKVSTLRLTAGKAQDGTMIRCTPASSEGGDSKSQEASLFLLPKAVIGLSLEEPYKTAGPAFVDVREIPVEVTYADGSKERILGLNHLRFMEKEESIQASPDGAGNQTHTMTTVVKEQTYSHVGIEEKEVMLRYEGSGGTVETACLLVGTDQTPPEITEVEVSPFSISREDKPVPVTVTIRAEDAQTPYPALRYAFLPEGQEPQEEDWRKKGVLEVEITQNGQWTAYCRDEAGNIASASQMILAVDQKAPVLDLSLEEEGFCESTRILASAEDSGPVRYRFTCVETGEDSGWTQEAAWPVKENGTWKVEARDEAGNVSGKEIPVTNIDRTPPVIHSIKTKERE